jgi:hypothetical protein
MTSVFRTRSDSDRIHGEQAPGLPGKEMQAPFGIVVGEIELPRARGPAVALIVVRRHPDAEEVQIVISGQFLHRIQDAFDQKRYPGLPSAAVEFIFAILRRKWIGDEAELHALIHDRIVLPIHGTRRQVAAPGQLDAVVQDARRLGGKRLEVGPIGPVEGRRYVSLRLRCLRRRDLLLGLGQIALDLLHLILQLLHLALHAIDLIRVG